MDELQLDDFVYSYPDQDDPDFQTLITAKNEFLELQSSSNDPIPPRGEFFKHQILFHRFLSIYNKCLVIHKTGTGKTCAGGGYTEKVKRALIDQIDDYVEYYIKPHRTNIKHVYIL